MSQEANKDKKRKLWLDPMVAGLALSLLVHISFFYARFHPRDQDAPKPSDEPIEISALPKDLVPPETLPKKKEPPRAKELQIAETEDANNRKIDPNAKFLSEHNQAVEKQTRAQTIDDFRKKQGSGLKNENKQAKAPTPPTADEQSGSSEVEAETGEGATAENKKKGSQGIKRDWKTLSLKDLSVGGDGGATAATDDKLDGVSDDERTILSTREFKFFSYYQRIKELLRQFWKPNVERKLAKIYQSGKNITEDELTTKILVLLDEKGGIKKMSRVAGSGFDDVDEAALDAFRKAAPFPNPPKGMIDADGFVRIRWDFILTVEAAPRIQFQSAGNAPTY